jgi:hypothetical protein
VIADEPTLVMSGAALCAEATPTPSVDVTKERTAKSMLMAITVLPLDCLSAHAARDVLRPGESKSHLTMTTFTTRQLPAIAAI